MALTRTITKGERIRFDCELLPTDSHGSGHKDMACILTLPDCTDRGFKSYPQYSLRKTDAITLTTAKGVSPTFSNIYLSADISDNERKITLIMKVNEESELHMGPQYPDGFSIRKVYHDR